MQKKSGLFVVCLLAMLGASGCIQMEHELQLHGDGSAVYRLQYAITEQAVAQFRAMLLLRRDLALAAGDPPEPDPLPLIKTFLDPSVSAIREHVLAWQPYGVTIRSLRENTRSLWRDYALVLDIADIQQLPNIPFFARHGFSLERNQEGQYVLDRAPLVTQPGSIPPRFSPEELEQIKPFLAGFDTEINIQVPGRIVSTTAGRTSLQTAIWRFNFDRQPESLHQLLQQPFHLVFQAPGITLPEWRLPETERE